MSFLKALGKFARIGLQILGVAPQFAALTPSTRDDQIVAKLNDTFGDVAQSVVIVETALEQATGTAKFDALVPLANLAIRRAEILRGREIANEALFTAGVRGVAQGVGDILNSLKDDLKTKEGLPK